ncbi:hypothetical protein CO151_09505 [bacterium CG_4_9_14_3_um_filter_65_15]|nr:MAG: hypothetical protein CO151_09505 [bacterium CG_4_9_14_3_um_filter_65_15]
MTAVAGAPLAPENHERLGDAWFEGGRHVPAAACYRTAAALGGAGSELERKLAGTRMTGDTLAAMDHNRHYRMTTLAAFLRGICSSEDFELLDVGGGDGLLAQHLPRASYRLAEPATNGLRGEALPFSPESVDVVCACHVLEHVQPEDRFGFLDALRERARRHLVLLNPFRIPGGRYEERLRAVIDLTNAGWAREHLACGLPETTVIEEYAAARGLTFTISPNGAMPTAFLGTLVSHYAHLAGRAADLDRINGYLNAVDPDLMTHPGLPAAMLVHFPLG